MKKVYQKPCMATHEVELTQMVCDSIQRVGGGTFNENVQGGNGSARGREYDDWDD